ncbi:coatomer subunit epsilon-like, partial [Galendromus occidentalis]|uniref:Coatomer subunit epsilon n=1 Tax=Galendromus occidentalis TaxID=34638 RepID=A0AAJ6QP55_9ACAR
AIRASEDPILVFSRETASSWVGYVQRLFEDGTFSLAPDQFAQVFVILADRGGYAIPLCYALLPNKSENSYRRMIDLVMGAFPSLNPASIAMDFEMAVINAFIAAFPNAEIHGCLFLFVQKCGFRGLLVLYNCDILEAMALSLQCYVHSDRLDLATNEMKRMVAKDEDASLTQLCSGLLYLALGGDNLEEAFYIFTEMAEKNTKTPLLSVGLASVLIAQGKFEEADSVLAESLEKDPNHLETVINQVVVSQFLGKSSEVCTRLLSQLKNSNQSHPFILDHQLKEQLFQTLCRSFAN